MNTTHGTKSILNPKLVHQYYYFNTLANMNTHSYYVVSYIVIRLSDFNQHSLPSYCVCTSGLGGGTL